MANKIQIKRGLQANLPTLSVGEPALTTNSGSEGVFIGTGTGNKRIGILTNGTASIPTTWSASPNAQGYYTRTVTVSGILSSDNIDITCVKLASDSSAGKLIQKAWNLIDMVAITTNTLTFYAFEKPTVAIPITWKRVK